MTVDICDHSEGLADMWHGTEHGPDTLDFSRTSHQDHVRAHACMCAHVRVRFGDVAVLLRNSKDQKVRKPKSEKRWGKLDRAHKKVSNPLSLYSSFLAFQAQHASSGHDKIIISALRNFQNDKPKEKVTKTFFSRVCRILFSNFSPT